MRNLIIGSLVGLVTLIITSTAFAESFCGRSYRFDSYGRGIEAGYKGIANLRPKMIDEGCYLLGLRRGVETKNQTENNNCANDFQEGYDNGFKASSTNSGTACFSAGFIAGGAALRAGAREHDVFLVGQRCVEEYNRGYNDGRTDAVATVSGRETDDTCYLAGFDDGGLFR